MGFSQSTRNRRSAARIVAAYALAFLVSAPCCFVAEATAAPAAGVEHPACHDEGAPADSGACVHATSPAAIGATDSAIQFTPSYQMPAAASSYALVPAARRLLVPPRKPPPLAAGPVPLFLLNLHLLN